MDETFDVPITPMLARLQGEWEPVELVVNGEACRSICFVSAQGSEPETRPRRCSLDGSWPKSAAARRNEDPDRRGLPSSVRAQQRPDLAGNHRMDRRGHSVLHGRPGEPRPKEFTSPSGSNRTLGQWRKK